MDVTTVPFTTNMTAIVGPNGCGKSNIIDAVRWVMGESSAKNLRGESMADVIFNGSSARQPVGQATIELLFDNSEGRLRGEHAAFSDISIKRKVTREGISQYYLNGSKCRRRDVTDIFLGTGMGPRSYAIIEQGMITRLIESKPEELRVYLEEAAGISKYKERRRETENRIRHTQENLERLSDIRDELGKQIQHLQRQAKAAEKYTDYKAQERLILAKLSALKWRTLDEESKCVHKDISANEVQIEKSVLDKLTRDNALEGSRTELVDKQQTLEAAQAKFYESGASIAKIEHEYKYKKERFAQQATESERLESERVTLLQQQQTLTEELRLLRYEHDELVPIMEETAESTEISHQQMAGYEMALHDWRIDWDSSNGEVSQLRQSTEVSKIKIEQMETALEQFLKRQERLASEQSELSEQIAHVEVEDLVLNMDVLSERILTCEAQISGLDEELSAQQNSLKQVDHKRREGADELAESKAVLASLNTLQRAAFDETDSDHADWLNCHGLDGEKRCFDDLDVEPGWELAVEHVLGPWLKGISCDAELSSTLSLNEQSLSSLGRTLTLIDADVSSFENKPQTLARHVGGAGVFQAYLGNIFVVATIEDALQKRDKLEAGESIVCVDGTWMAAGWIRYFRVTEGTSGFVQRKQKISDLDTRIAVLQVNNSVLTDMWGETSNQVAELSERLKQQGLGLQVMRQEYARLESDRRAHVVRNEQYLLRHSRIAEELADVKTGCQETTIAIKQERVHWSSELESLEILSLSREAKQLEGDSAREQLDRSRSEVKLSQERLHQLEIVHQKSLSQETLLVQKLGTHDIGLNAVIEKLKATDGLENIQAEDLEVLALTLEGQLEARLFDESRLSDIREQVDAVSLAIKQLESERSLSENDMQLLRADLESKRMALQAIEINKAGCLEKIAAEDFQLNTILDQLVDEDSDTSLESDRHSLAAKIQRLGAINLAAIDEYEEKSERKAYLDAQNNELVEALDILISAIKKIDKETRFRFKETYDQVNEGLQRLFPKIFGGGNAHLELTDDDLLETGVTIIARPPGKKNSTIHLLSGGEKALTAIALIFAIFELNPAPFCMLDEVDAPLDDANVGRFASMVKEMSEQVQFIYISHNKVSMEKADQLMGVTMHEPGVSRLVSVDVEEAAALAQA